MQAHARRRFTRGSTPGWLFLLVSLLGAACQFSGSKGLSQERWWEGFGPVVPHDSFPADCTLCHVGRDWNELVEDFEFDHLAETGVALSGSHQRAACLRCHNDRGPVEVFTAKGCAGCHEDVHLKQLGPNCTECHGEVTWRAQGMIERHRQTRFPLNGAHAVTSCRRCHPGWEVGRFVPTDTECVTCHQADLANALGPNHFALGWVDQCDRCHLPTTWNQAEINPID